MGKGRACLVVKKPQVQSPALHKTWSGDRACNPSTQEVGTGELEIQGHSRLCKQFKATLGYKRPRSLPPHLKIKGGVVCKGKFYIM